MLQKTIFFLCFFSNLLIITKKKFTYFLAFYLFFLYERGFSLFNKSF